MSDKRRPDEKPWEPTIEKLPGFNPFANDQNSADEPEHSPELDDLEDDSDEDIPPRERR
jgi:hypothetical protein